MSYSKFILELFGSDVPISGDAPEILNRLSEYGSRNLAHGGDPGCNPGYIFRGEINYDCPLRSKLERGEPKTSDEKLNEKEKELFTNFVSGDGGRIAAIIDEQSGEKISQPPTDIFWWLSLMQHYGHPTRLIDFTKDIRIALFFAIQHLCDERKQKRPDKDLIIYCFPCKDLKHPHDNDSNKCPFLPSANLASIDMNLVLARQIGFSWTEPHEGWFPKNEPEKYYIRKKQSWGWDRPYYQNPRLKFQKGMFLYPYEYPKELKSDGDTWLVQNLRVGDRFNMGTANDLPPKRIRIPFKHATELKNFLKTRDCLNLATVYVDYAQVEIDQSSSRVQPCQPLRID